MIDRRTFIRSLATGLCVAPFAANAQQAVRAPRIGFLSPYAPSDFAGQVSFEAFRQGLRDLGYVEGQNVVLEPRWAEGNWERLPELAVQLARLKVAVIVTATSPAVHAAKDATTTIPIVMAYIIDPVATGFVVTFARPGGNVTGLSMMAPELVRKQLELLTSRYWMTVQSFIGLNALESRSMNCPRCRMEIPRDAAFCPKCAHIRQ